MKPWRALIAAVGLLLVAAAAWILRERGPGGLPFWPGCLLRKATGIECPGCGMTRASYAMLHGRLGEAFALNPVGMVLLPLALIGLSLEVAGWVRGRPLALRLRPGRYGSRIILAAVVIFAIGRNLPWWPQGWG